MSGSPLIFGEVLFDRFDGEEVLGGAPFNVAWHLQGFGLKPLLISRIGKDRLGQQVSKRMQQWGMEMKGVQIDFSRPTGTVEVKIQDGEPHYEILPHQAYDQIDATAARTALEGQKISLLYHGTLAMREPQSEHAYQTLQKCVRPIFVDVNLRTPWWKQDQVIGMLGKASWGKMNSDELFMLTRDKKRTDLKIVAEKFRQDMGLEGLIVTMGEQGAGLFTREKTEFVEAVPVDRMVDTVGAGDGFSAVCIVGLSRGWEPSLMLKRAVLFASEILQQRGATKVDRALYQKIRMRWSE